MTDSHNRLGPTDAARPDVPRTNRRQVLYGAGVIVGTTVLAGCGSGTSSANTGSGGAGAGVGGGSATVPASQVPVGGGKILDSPAVVVTQPTPGQFKAFSSICPHAGCPVTAIQSGVIVCPCHGSQFAIATGDVVAGPAPHGLDPLNVTVSGSNLVVS